jgi:hypothetical protein
MLAERFLVALYNFITHSIPSRIHKIYRREEARHFENMSLVPLQSLRISMRLVSKLKMSIHNNDANLLQEN